MNQANVSPEIDQVDEYVTAFRGRFSSLLRWEQLDVFWETLKAQADDGWYIYHVGEEAPQQTSSKQQLLTFIDEINTLLRTEHQEDYCAIVYADDHEHPGFIKIFDPHNLGVSCGSSENPPLPGWLLSRITPVNLENALRPPNNRRRWWQRIFE
ncbi:MAG: hypothetical protein EP315_00215 [Gammaproteobacteria bacterium]|nr:MAG: hypothetical protein EP315_00215 [Gammaproteobacteria bacterium]